MDPEEDRDYLYIALEGLRAPVPEPWEVRKNEEGDVFFCNPETEEVMVNHPLDDFYRNLFQEIKARDLKAKKQAEKEKQMRKTAGKLQGLGPLKPPKAQGSHNKFENEEEVFLPNKGDKITNISNISSNQSKKSNSFLGENQNKDSLDLNSSSIKSVERPANDNASSRNSPLKKRKLKLSNNCSNRDIDRLYQINMEKLLNEKEAYLEKVQKDILEKKIETQSRLEDQFMAELERMRQNKTKRLAELKSFDKGEEQVKERLKKSYEDILSQKIQEKRSSFDRKKNIFKEDAQKSNLETFEELDKKQAALLKEKRNVLEKLKNKSKQTPERKKPEESETVLQKKKTIEKEIKETYDKLLDRFRVDELRKIRARKESEIENLEKSLEIRRMEINNEFPNDFKNPKKSLQKEIYERKIEIEKNSIAQTVQDELENFKEVQEQEVNKRIWKYKNMLQEREIILFHDQILEEKETLKRIYQRKLEVIKLAKNKNKEGSDTKKMEHLDKTMDEIQNLLVFYFVIFVSFHCE